ncbi:unnamed protein product [Ceutorhynchus assimilis]|uniref:Cleavage and polyadenylation specificity factor subunit 4 n=1 Tax=Ceutorhynchus assimilis TaxID=467358 RepID=A0A9N9M955_9CUCU|nr:unnamed protein product [Ceutorhynchus assimilis]
MDNSSRANSTFNRNIVCSNWLLGSCKDEQCKFLHHYVVTKIPRCYYYLRFKACIIKECPFLHTDSAIEIKDCPFYGRGFCRRGPLCLQRHERRVMCSNYLAGFCQKGGTCKDEHPRFRYRPRVSRKKIICHYCGKQGHTVYFCNRMRCNNRAMDNLVQLPRKNKCWKCGSQGHYANNCLRRHLALGSAAEGVAEPEKSDS